MSLQADSAIHALQQSFSSLVAESITVVKDVVSPPLEDRKKIRYIISRFEYDAIPPKYRIVGFTLRHSSSEKQEYLETTIALDRIKDMCDQEVCDVAFEQLKDRIKLAKASLTSIIGKEYVPFLDDD
jgi:hypothetical protein